MQYLSTLLFLTEPAFHSNQNKERHKFLNIILASFKLKNPWYLEVKELFWLIISYYRGLLGMQLKVPIAHLKLHNFTYDDDEELRQGTD